VGLHRIVVLGGDRVGLLDPHLGIGECLVRLAALVVLRLLRFLRALFKEMPNNRMKSP
jgi:hypothetical protein